MARSNNSYIFRLMAANLCYQLNQYHYEQNDKKERGEYGQRHRKENNPDQPQNSRHKESDPGKYQRKNESDQQDNAERDHQSECQSG